MDMMNTKPWLSEYPPGVPAEVTDAAAESLGAAMGLAEAAGAPGLAERAAAAFTDAMQQTTQPGVFAAGDLARAASNITLATSDGMIAAHALFRSLVEEEAG